MSAQWLRAARDTGVALAGFDDIEVADLLQLPLSVIAYDAAEVGRAAARLLFDEPGAQSSGAAVEDGGKQRRVVVPTTMVEHP